MSRARSAIAARTSIAALKEAACKVFGCQTYETAEFEEFYDVAHFCRTHSEELGGDDGSDGWYCWESDGWVILGDLSLNLVREPKRLAELCAALGTDLVAAAVDIGFEFALFGYASEGVLVRRLLLEDEEIIEEGNPVKAERGRHLEDFSEEEAERLWTSYGLPTFEHDPLDGHFECVAVRRDG